jgi:DNA repair exonuclease SbcCD ATPase subunit
MKLRAIRLANVRRFAGQSVTVAPFGDGLSVIAAPNETGKSTLFDALHALFFAPHGSRARDVVALQPHSGGRVEVGAEIELPEGRFLVEKAFLARPVARVTDLATGRIVAQEDAAEAWLGRLTASALHGPAGLLWVRQGVTTLEAEGRERDRLVTARRDLLSSVAGEIDKLTGGRRMDRVRDACLAALGQLVTTATNRPRKGGPWAEVREEIAARDAEIATLEGQSRALADALTRRREIAGHLARIEAPEARAARDAALAAAEAALAAAEAHAARLAAATQEAEVARLTAEEARRQAAAFEAALAPLARLAAAETDAATAVESLDARMSAVRAAEERARAAHLVAQDDLSAARTAAGAARLATAARDAARLRDDLVLRLAAAETQAAALAAAEMRLAALRVTPEGLSALDRALAALATARAAAAARAVTLTVIYDPGAPPILRDGAALRAGPIAVTAQTRLTLPGIGGIEIDPGAATADPAALATAEGLVARALAACGADTPDAARKALRDREAAQSARALAAELLRAHAPDGLPALRAALAAAAVKGDAAPAAEASPDPARLPACEIAEAAARDTLEAARAAIAALAPPLAEARAALTLAASRRADAEIAAGDSAGRADRRSALAAAASAAAATQTRAAAARETLAAAAPDLATARAERARTLSARESAQAEAARLREEQARLVGMIQTQADLAVDERLAAARDARAAAADREARLAAESAALARLAAVLDTTRAAARETYFGPVEREIAPLLALLSDTASLTFDAESLLPDRLARDGAEEPLATLSGGTQEQVAILTRLAFARLFARAGTPVPVILDDALVHTDDVRILRMFTALHRVAADQQVIVLTCRTAAFEALGGARPVLTVAPL